MWQLEMLVNQTNWTTTAIQWFAVAAGFPECFTVGCQESEKLHYSVDASNARFWLRLMRASSNR